VIEVPRRGQDHLVARPGEGGHDGGECLIAALGDGDLFRCNRATIASRPLLRDFSAQRGQAEDRAVKVCRRIVQCGFGKGLTQPERRRIHRGGLADVD
jgi:hypothetical protein